MYLWLLITLALTVQEGLSVLAVLLRAYQLHYPLLVIHAIWLTVTVLQIAFGYFFGKRIQKQFAGSKFEVWVEKQARALEKSIDKRGEKVGLMLFSSIISPGVGAFLASWLDISFKSVFIYSLIGDLFWYISTWATVLGAEKLLSGMKEGLIILLIIVMVVIVISHVQKNRKSPQT